MKLTLVVDDDDGPELIKSALEAELVFWRSVAREGAIAHAQEKCIDLVGLIDQVERQVEEKRR